MSERKVICARFTPEQCHDVACYWAKPHERESLLKNERCMYGKIIVVPVTGEE